MRSATCFAVHAAAVLLAPTATARAQALRAQAQAVRDADDLEYTADPAGYRLRGERNEVGARLLPIPVTARCHV